MAKAGVIELIRNVSIVTHAKTYFDRWDKR